MVSLVCLPLCSCFVAVLRFTLVCTSKYIVNRSRHSIIVVVSGYCFFSFLVRAFCMRLLNSILDEIGNSSFACWFCLNFSLEIAPYCITAEKIPPYFGLPLPPKSLPPKNEKPPTAKKLPPYCITAEKIRPYFGLPLPPKSLRPKNEKPP